MSELAVDGVPVVVSCRVLKLARQPYYRWLAEPISKSERDPRAELSKRSLAPAAWINDPTRRVKPIDIFRGARIVGT